MSQVFVAQFADGEVARMTTYCEGDLNWEHGKKVAKHAWQTRDRRYRIERFLAEIEDRTPPEITECHFEMANGEIVSEPSEPT
jgi:hypothetical protein